MTCVMFYSKPITYSAQINPVVYVSLGGNTGDVLATCSVALQSMSNSGILIEAVSYAYKTKAVTKAPVADIADFWNIACRVRTTLSPHALLQLLHALEQQAGRSRSTCCQINRPLDIDILLYGHRISLSRHITLPHPRLHQRLFVLKPLLDVGAANCIIPLIGKTVMHMYQTFSDTTQSILYTQSIFNFTNPESM